MELKIGREIYVVKNNDYIYFNGVLHMFCSGDNRVLKQSGFDQHRYIVIPKSVLKKIKLTDLKQEVKKDGTYYIFNNIK